MKPEFEHIDKRITHWMAQNGIDFLRYSIAFIFIWFGGLKFFPGVSPAEALATSTIELLTFGLIPHDIILFLLASLEVGIGLLLFIGKTIRFTFALLIAQMLGTLTPILFFPELVFTVFPYGLTIEGQYIIKNVVIISAAIVIGATARGGYIVSKTE